MNKKNISILIKFGIIGVFNTFIGIIMMFFLYDYLNLGYWGASSITYIIASIFSFFANCKYTFKYKNKTPIVVFKFFVNIVICYGFAYLLAKPLSIYLLSGLQLIIEAAMIEKISMLIGTCLFTMINFLGQKFYVFKENHI